MTLPYGTSSAVLNSLTPTITITGASVSPASGVAQNFTVPVSYTVTAADGSVQTYTVSVTITVPQWVAVTGLPNPSASFTGVTNGPVQYANWYHALVFCNKLSMAEGLTPVYTISGATDPAIWIANNAGIVPVTSNATWDAVTASWNTNGYRLPTEAEWMWAAMGADLGLVWGLSRRCN